MEKIGAVVAKLRALKQGKAADWIERGAVVTPEGEVVGRRMLPQCESGTSMLEGDPSSAPWRRKAASPVAP